MTNLIKYILLSAVWLIAFESWAFNADNSSVNDPLPVQTMQDSIIINIDNDTKIIIFVKNKTGLEKLRNYDINAMIRDLSVRLDSANNPDYVKIEDESGERYLQEDEVAKDENDTEEERSGDYDRFGHNDDYSNHASFKIGNYKIEVDPDQVRDFDIRIENTDEGGDSSRNNERFYNRTKHEFNLEIGVNNYLENDNFPDGNTRYNVKPWGSWYVGLSSIHRTALGRGPLFVEWGGTLNWYNFKLDNADYKIVKTETGTEYLDPEPGVSGIKSKLTASYINFVVVPMIDFSKGYHQIKKYESSAFSISKYKKQGLRIGVGGYAGYRLGSHTKYKFKLDGDNDTDKSNGNFNLNNFRYGLRGQVGYKGIDMFINYDLNDLFNENQGPANLQAISFGILL